MRLTEKNCELENDKLNAIYQKLADLEDIEDELGIDLVTLFNEEFKKITKCYIKKEQFLYAPNFIKSMKYPRDSKGRFVKRS